MGGVAVELEKLICIYVMRAVAGSLWVAMTQSKVKWGLKYVNLFAIILWMTFYIIVRSELIDN